MLCGSSCSHVCELLLCFAGFAVYFCPSAGGDFISVSLSTSAVVTPVAPQQTDSFSPFRNSLFWKLHREEPAVANLRPQEDS